MAKGFPFTEGDTGSVLRITCRNYDGSVIDLTGATVKIRWKNKAGTLVSKSMAIVGAPSNGVVEYQFAAGELLAPKMELGYRITDSSGNTISSSKLDVVLVRKPLE